MLIVDEIRARISEGILMPENFELWVPDDNKQLAEVKFDPRGGLSAWHDSMETQTKIINRILFSNDTAHHAFKPHPLPRPLR